MTRIISRLKSWFSQAPAARAYLLKYGLRQTMIRVFDALVRSPQHGSLVALNCWLDNDSNKILIKDACSQGLAKPSVALIGSLDLPQCKKYRVVQKVEQLGGQHNCTVKIASHQDVPRAFDALQLATAVIFYRVPDSEVFQGYLKEAKRLGIPVCYDIDDPIFSRAIYTANANLATLSGSEKKHLLNDTAKYLAAMKQCDACIVSTPGMLEAATRYIDAPVYLWRNAIDAQSLAIAKELAPSNCDEVVPQTLRIGYMSGSRAHDLDFELIVPALKRILETHSHVELVLAGHAKLPKPLEAFSSRISRRPFTSYRGYFQTISEVDIVVIPLLHDAFNACKSAIRFLEAGLLQKPTVVSAVGDFLHLVKDQETGFLAYSTEDWIDALDTLVRSAEIRTSTGAQAKSEILSQYTSTVIASRLSPDLLALLTGASHE